jgi:hypothetical protein
VNAGLGASAAAVLGGCLSVLLVSTVSCARCLTHDLCRESDSGA